MKIIGTKDELDLIESMLNKSCLGTTYESINSESNQFGIQGELNGITLEFVVQTEEVEDGS